jgi:hypothetical protein
MLPVTMTRDFPSGTYNLLELTNGKEILLKTFFVSVGHISELHVELGGANILKVNGQVHNLPPADSDQLDVYVQLNKTLEAGITYKVLLDFDVAHSIVRSCGSYRLKPLVRAVTEAENGAINGVVDPKESMPAICAITGNDTVGTTYQMQPDLSFCAAFRPALADSRKDEHCRYDRRGY